jgi:hypothetical protein
MYPKVATGLNNLAAIYREQGQYGKAEPFSNAHWRPIHWFSHLAFIRSENSQSQRRSVLRPNKFIVGYEDTEKCAGCGEDNTVSVRLRLTKKPRR